jgi:hypothetical protein
MIRNMIINWLTFLLFFQTKYNIYIEITKKQVIKKIPVRTLAYSAEESFQL